MVKTKTTIILLLLIIALGLFLRLYRINYAPPGIYPDEAVNGMDALTVAKTGHFQLFYPANNVREGLFINVMALGFKLLGVSILTLKLPTILFGTLTIWGIYLLAQETFNRRVGLISSFLVAVSFWPLNFSRIAFRAMAVPAILVFSFYFLFRGLRTKKWTDFALGGFIFGLGIHTYIAARITPLILMVGLFFFILAYSNFLKIYWKHLIVFSLFSFLSAFPMFYTFFYSHPEYWQSRTSEISILNP
ncbi:MAG TPA: glycosyltransferase family 39 protein, partial [Candidatus Moranbacteria bacterium]|nr:glycosyltransferase family 39 protein [Candidatus Moranbacteria bacterium]